MCVCVFVCVCTFFLYTFFGKLLLSTKYLLLSYFLRVFVKKFRKKSWVFLETQPEIQYGGQVPGLVIRIFFFLWERIQDAENFILKNIKNAIFLIKLTCEEIWRHITIWHHRMGPWRHIYATVEWKKNFQF